MTDSEFENDFFISQKYPSRTDLSETDLSGFDLRNTTLDETILKDVTYDDEPQWSAGFDQKKTGLETLSTRLEV